MKESTIGMIFIAFTLFLVGVLIVRTPSTDTRDYKYEAYCDSIWSADKDYYMDVLAESDKYQEYIQTNGEWWH